MSSFQSLKPSVCDPPYVGVPCDFQVHPSLYQCPNQNQYQCQTPPWTAPPTPGFFHKYTTQSDYIKQHEQVFMGAPCFAPAGFTCNQCNSYVLQNKK